jgi:tRNA wybutosine-synthesizing protein 3
MDEKETRFWMVKKHHTETFLKAKKDGKMDQDFIPLCQHTIKTKNYFTSSCCSGRISLIGLNKEEEKRESAFHRKWHRIVKLKEIEEGINSYKGHILWFKQEPLILHLGTNTIDNAKKILVTCEKVGLKRAGIKVVKEGKYIVEILGTHNITTPIKEGKMVVEKKYLTYLVKKANEKFLKNQEILNKLTKQVKKDLK